MSFHRLILMLTVIEFPPDLFPLNALTLVHNVIIGNIISIFSDQLLFINMSARLCCRCSKPHSASQWYRINIDCLYLLYDFVPHILIYLLCYSIHISSYEYIFFIIFIPLEPRPATPVNWFFVVQFCGENDGEEERTTAKGENEVRYFLVCP